MKIFIINGFPRSGKTLFENFVKNYAWNTDRREISIYSIIDPVKEVAKSVGWEGGKEEKDRKFLCDLKRLLSEYNDFSFAAVKNKVAAAEECKRAAIFIDMREKEDIERFKELYNCKTVLVEREAAATSYGNSADDNVMDIEYDLVVANDKDIANLQRVAIDFYNYNIKSR